MSYNGKYIFLRVRSETRSEKINENSYYYIFFNNRLKVIKISKNK